MLPTSHSTFTCPFRRRLLSNSDAIAGLNLARQPEVIVLQQLFVHPALTDPLGAPAPGMKGILPKSASNLDRKICGLIC